MKSILLFAGFIATALTDDLIDPQQMPLEGAACYATSSCWHNYSPPDVIGSCDIDTSTCSGNSTNCGKYHSDCYCQLKTPLQCAWVCDWWTWMKIEDWLFEKCPGAPQVDFNKAPRCAAQCLAEKTFDYGCLTRNTNCFCIHGDLFDCQQACGEKDKGALKSWFAETCGVPEIDADAAVYTADGSSTTESAAKGPIYVAGKRRKLRWYEALDIALLVISFLAAVGFWALMSMSEKGRGE